MAMTGNQGHAKHPVPVNATSTKMKCNPNWNRRHPDGKHKPKENK